MSAVKQTATFDAYILCTSPRSGSTLLCHMLRDAGAGHPDSWFHRPSVAAWATAHGVQGPASDPAPLADVFNAARHRGRTGTDLFGLRMQRHSFAYFAARLRDLHPDCPDDVTRIRAAFGRTAFVHLTRQDKVAQAVSYILATQTGLWHANPKGQELERTAPARDPAYDRDAIAARIALAEADDRAWRRWFTAEGLEPFSVTYDALSADPGMVLAQTLDHLGLDPELARGITPATGKLADRVSRDWIARFNAG